MPQESDVRTLAAAIGVQFIKSEEAQAAGCADQLPPLVGAGEEMPFGFGWLSTWFTIGTM